MVIHSGDLESLKLSSNSGDRKEGTISLNTSERNCVDIYLSCLTIGDQINSVCKRIMEEMCARKQTVSEYPGLILT